MFKVFPYKLFSESATAISRALKVKRIRPEGHYSPSDTCVILNWGNSSLPYTNCRVINLPGCVAVAANKLHTFEALKRAGVPVPEFTTNRTIAQGWLSRGFRVFARHKLNGHNGDGIQVVEAEDTLPAAPLYVKYQRKDKEYRVHVFNGSIIDITEKRRRNGTSEEGSSFIRNLRNGWVFCRDGVYPCDRVRSVSVDAVRSLGLDFGAVDIIERNGQVWVLEVNCAPGLQGTTLDRYISAIKNTYAEALRPRIRRLRGQRRVSRHRIFA
jgi:glutathione synthase/RimK-type ligase-like ATP-grasp enzyme